MSDLVITVQLSMTAARRFEGAVERATRATLKMAARLDAAAARLDFISLRAFTGDTVRHEEAMLIRGWEPDGYGLG
jgi:acyl CoA:acetate/3-ketoacid CoA transferase alpha subunit